GHIVANSEVTVHAEIAGERRKAENFSASPRAPRETVPSLALALRLADTMSDPQPFQVAVVDDDPAIRRLVRLLLKRSGYESVEFGMGEEARAQLTTIAWDLAILDRRLPDMDGVDLCHQLKSDPELRNRYIIMLTG